MRKVPCPLSARAVSARPRLFSLIMIGTKNGPSKEVLICIMNFPSDEEMLDHAYAASLVVGQVSHCFLSFILNKDIECMETFANKCGQGLGGQVRSTSYLIYIESPTGLLVACPAKITADGKAGGYDSFVLNRTLNSIQKCREKLCNII